MAQIAVQYATLDEAALGGATGGTLGSTGESDTFTNDGATLLVIRTAVASPPNITIASPTNCNYGFNHPVEVTPGAALNDQVIVGPFDPGRFNDDEGNVTVSYANQAQGNRLRLAPISLRS